MVFSKIKSVLVPVSLAVGVLALSGCDYPSTGSSHAGVYYDSMMWNDYYRPRPPRPPKPEHPIEPPQIKPPKPVHPIAPRPPVSRPPVSRPPVSRPSPRPSPRR